MKITHGYQGVITPSGDDLVSQLLERRKFDQPYSYIFIVPLGLLVLGLIWVIIKRKGRRHNTACLLPQRQRHSRHHQQQAIMSPSMEYLPRYEPELAPPPAYTKSQV